MQGLSHPSLTPGHKCTVYGEATSLIYEGASSYS
jgi:hypothetical protein